MACLQIYRELLSLVTFLRVHSNSKEVSYLSWQNTYPNLKTTCHVKLKIFSWTKLLENLLYAKYLISVTAPLNYKLIYVTRTHDFVFCKLFPNFFSIYGHCNQQNFSLTFKSYSKTCFISIYGIAIWKILV